MLDLFRTLGNAFCNSIWEGLLQEDRLAYHKVDIHHVIELSIYCEHVAIFSVVEAFPKFYLFICSKTLEKQRFFQNFIFFACVIFYYLKLSIRLHIPVFVFIVYIEFVGIILPNIRKIKFNAEQMTQMLPYH